MDDCKPVLSEKRQRLGNTPSSETRPRRTCWTHGVAIEIWEMIFSVLCLSLHEFSFIQHPDSPLLGLPPLVVSQVCSCWRMIAKGYPRLWTSIAVRISQPPFDVVVPPELTYDFTVPLESYLVNSKDYPLNIRITGDPTSVPPWGVDIWTTLSPHIHRSRELTLALPYPGETDHLPPIQQLTFPNLEHYRDHMLPGFIPPWPWLWQAIRTAPKLVRLYTQSVRSAIIPFSHLTTWELQVSPIEADVLLNTLRRCSNLDSLTLRCYTTEFDPHFFTVTPREVKLPLLRRISIIAPSGHDWSSGIIDSLNTPILEFCQITMPLISSKSFGMVWRSSSLRELKVNIQPRSGLVHSLEPLIDVLQSVPQLIDFGLYLVLTGNSDYGGYHSPVNDVVSTLLLKLGGSHHFLPNIRRISLVLPFVRLSAKLVKRVLKVVSVRQLTHCPLTNFSLVRSKFGRENYGEFVMGTGMKERIGALGENGIKVVVEDELAK